MNQGAVLLCGAFARDLGFLLLRPTTSKSAFGLGYRQCGIAFVGRVPPLG